MNNLGRFEKGGVPWNKGLKGSQVPWNKGLTRALDPRIIAPWEGKKRPDFPKGIPHLKARGENNCRWIKDRTQIKDYWSERRNNPEYKQWRIQVKMRDSFRCKISNDNCEGRLEVHHILSWSEFPELRYKINNGITLCHAHHPRKRAEEKRLVSEFQALVSVSK